MTVEEFLAISEQDPRPMELIDGEVVVLSHPAILTRVLQAVLIGALVAWEHRVPGRARVAARLVSSSGRTITTARIL